MIKIESCMEDHSAPGFYPPLDPMYYNDYDQYRWQENQAVPPLEHQPFSDSLNLLGDSQSVYTDMQSMEVKAESPEWRNKRPTEWNDAETAGWLRYLSEKSLEWLYLQRQAFSGLNGAQLINMKIEDLRERDPLFAEKLYNELIELQIARPKSFVNNRSQPEFDAERMDSLSQIVNLYQITEENLGDTFNSLGMLPPFETLLHQNPVIGDGSDTYSDPPSPADSGISTISNSSTPSPSPPTTTRSRRAKGKGKLWEFIRDLLLNKEHNPESIKWEDRKEGVFRIVKSEKIAELWGIRKTNNTMTYEKMSRAMRYTRSMGYLADLPKSHKYPRKLVFKFGPNASGWTTK